MSAPPRGAPEREAVLEPVGVDQNQFLREHRPLVLTRTTLGSSASEGHSLVNFGNSIRVSLMLVPRGRGAFEDQIQELWAAQRQVLHSQGQPMTVTSQTIFLRDPTDLPRCQQLFGQWYGAPPPATSYVLQPPCCGAAVALEAWAVGGAGVKIERYGPHTIAVDTEATRWIYCSGIESPDSGQGAYHQVEQGLNKMKSVLAESSTRFEQIVRTWFYLGSITDPEGASQRYQELNRARTDFYGDIDFHCSVSEPNIPQGIYPASTGIGMRGRNLVMSCVALQARQAGAFLLPLENPQQTPAYAYHPRFSPQSPKFSRAVALVLKDQTITWVSGTASVVHSLSRHPEDIERQTEQTIENIERLISSENFAFHGIKRAGARLSDLAKVRVYLKRQKDYPLCKAICDRRFGSVPTIYAVADVCRPELLVEIEGVAFSQRG